MKYFIDFEATQFSNEIISVGCVREDGETFYSLVAPVEGKITPFITNLTGITGEMLKEAMSPESVFDKFYDWVFGNGDEIPDFWTWGNSDVDFVRSTFKRTNSMKARMALGYLSGSIHDYGKFFCKKAGVSYPIAQLKIYKVFNEEAVQNHNALDDAMMLYNIWQEENSRTPSELKSYMREHLVVEINSAASASTAPVVKWNQMGLPVGTICVVDKKKRAMLHWSTIEEAAEWIHTNKFPEERRAEISIETLKKNIRKAYTGGKPYFSMNCRFITEGIAQQAGVTIETDGKEEV